MVGLMAASMITPPDLPEFLSKNVIKGKSVWLIAIIAFTLSIILLITSGIYKILLPNLSLGSSDGTGSGLGETLSTIVVLAFLILPVIFISYTGGKKK